MTLVPTTLFFFFLLIFFSFRMSEEILIHKIGEEAFSRGSSYADEFNVLTETSKKVAEGMALAIGTAPGLEDAFIKKLVRDNVLYNPNIYGSAIALIPASSPLGRYSPYFYRGPKGMESRSLAGGSYDYTKWDWFRIPLKEGKGSWGEPYYDEGGGNTLMTTYSAPIVRNGRPIGIATVDITLDNLVRRVKSLRVGTNGYAFVVSKKGYFIAHPVKRVLFIKESLWDQEGKAASADLNRVITLLKSGKPGSMEMYDPFRSRESWIVTMPIKSNGWMLAMIFPRDEVLRPLTRLRYSVEAVSIIIVALLVLVILWVTSSALSPVSKLVEQTQRYAEGHFAARLDESRGSREIKKLSKAFNVMGEAIAQKIMELKNSMEKRLALQGELHEKEKERLASEKASRMKSEFIAYVSHELRSPLTVIKGMASTLFGDDEGYLGPEERKEIYDTIESEADRLLVLINEFLDSSRIEAGCPLQLARRETDMGEVLRSIARMLKNYKYFTPEHHFELDIPEALPSLNVDHDKIVQVISNLVTNAIKYSPEGGEIRLSASSSDGKMLVSVADQGVGMDSEQAGKLFGRYERIEREDIKNISGTGLGLYLARHMVDLHGGRIWAESVKGKGSTFFLELPISGKA